jgi:hypothetical protein
MIVGYLLLILAIMQIVIGTYLISRYTHNLSTISYGVFAWCSAIYVGANGIGFTRLVSNPNIPEMIAWTGGVLVTCAFFFFSFNYPLPKRSLISLLPLLAWPVLFFVPALLFSHLVIVYQSNVLYGEPYHIHYGSFFWQFIIFLIVYWSWAITNLVKHLSSTYGTQRSVLNSVLLFATTWMVSALFFDIILPMAGHSTLSFMGSLVSAVWVIATTRIILRQ